MTEVLTDHRSDNLPAEQFGAGTVVTDYAYDAVILGYTTDGDVELCRSDGIITAYPASASLVQLIDPVRQKAALAAAVKALETERRKVTARHAETLQQVRLAAIEKHEDGGEICRDGLNAFLCEIGQAEYEPQVRVDFTIRGSYEVDTTDTYEARRGAEDNLGVELAGISDASEDSLTHEVEVTDVTLLGH